MNSLDIKPATGFVANLNEVIKMENEILKEIIEFATTKLNGAYDYCGVAEGSDTAILYSEDRKGNDIKIYITINPE